MDLELSDDQVALRDELRRFLHDRVGTTDVRSFVGHPGAVDRSLFEELGGLGLFGLALAEEDGGVGLGLAEATIAFEELGRALVPGPLIGTFVAAGLVDGAATGATIVGLGPSRVPAVVEHLDGLDRLLVVGDQQLSLIEQIPAGEAVRRPLDPLTPVHRISVVPTGEPIGGPGDAARAQEVASLLVAATQVGLGAGAVELATSYALERRQFSRPIGSFQAIKHLLADAHGWVDIARAAVHAAAVDLDEGTATYSDTATCGVGSARLVASAAAARATAACVQVHGGMGYTWEVDAHLFLKRAAVLDVTAGCVDDLAEARCTALGTAAGAGS